MPIVLDAARYTSYENAYGAAHGAGPFSLPVSVPSCRRGRLAPPTLYCDCGEFFMQAEFLYDAFISYNQKLDKPFVRRLQRHLQNLGRAWWQRRAVRIFRDESSLSATPELWPVIERALERSRYLIVCASPEAAASHWVNEEARWWLAHKSRETLLIALSAGELSWDRTANDFVWDEATPLPPAFKGAFGSEPKWTDFRAFRMFDEEHRRADEAFLSLAAELSSTIRGIPKEDLLSEELRQQRRALNTAYTAAASLALIAAIAGWEGYRAYVRGIEARVQRDEANKQRDEARKQKDEANRQRDEARRSRSVALSNLADLKTRDHQSNLAMHLALEALPDTPAEANEKSLPQAVTALDTAWRSNIKKVALGANGEKAIDVSPDATRFLTLSPNKQVSVYDVGRAEKVALIGEAAKRAEFAADHERVLIKTVNDEVKLFDVSSGKLLAKFDGDPGERPIYSKDGRRVMRVSKNRVELWDVLSGARGVQVDGEKFRDTKLMMRNRLKLQPAAAFNPDRKRIATTFGDATAQVWDAQTGELLTILKGHGTDVDAGNVTSVEFSSDGSQLLTGSWDASARIWNAQTGKPIKTVFQGNLQVHGASFNPDATKVVSRSLYNNAAIYDVKTGKLIANLTGHRSPITEAQFSVDGRFVLTRTDVDVRLWNAETGAELGVIENANGDERFSSDGGALVSRSALWELTFLGNSFFKVAQAVNEFAINSDQTLMALKFESALEVWSYETRNKLASIPKRPLKFLFVGREFLLTFKRSEPDEPQLWQATTGKQIVLKARDQNQMKQIVASPKGDTVIGITGTGAALFKTATGEKLFELQGQTAEIEAGAFSPDGTVVVTVAKDGSARLWDAKSGAMKLALSGLGKAIQHPTLTPDGQGLVTMEAYGEAVLAGDWEWHVGTAKLFDLTSGKVKSSVPLRGEGGGEIAGQIISPDGARLVTITVGSTGGWNNKREFTGQLWDLTRRQELASFHAASAHFSSDGIKLVTAGGYVPYDQYKNKTAYVWDAQSGKQLLALEGHEKGVSNAGFSPDGRRILTNAGDGTARIWDSTTGVQIALIKGLENAIGLATFTPDGHWIVTLGDDKAVRFWRNNATPWALIEQARSSIGDCLNREERMKYSLSPTVPEWCWDSRMLDIDDSDQIADDDDTKEKIREKLIKSLAKASRRIDAAQKHHVFNDVLAKLFVNRGEIYYKLAEQSKSEADFKRAAELGEDVSQFQNR